MEKSEFRVLIKHCYLMRKNTVQTQHWLEKCYGKSAPSKTTICRWFADFKRGRKRTDDAERSGRPKEVVSPENIKKILQIIVDNRKVKLQEIADSLRISKGSVFTILHKNLGMKKLFSKWVPRLLTAEQKQQRVADSKRCLELFNHYRKDFFMRYVTMDETWIHYYTVESDEQSVEVPIAKRPKSEQPVDKIKAFVFWDAHGILYIDYLEKGKTMNSEHYITLLTRLKDEIIKKRPHIENKKVLFHQDNTISKAVISKLHELDFELLPHQPDSPDLAPSDYYLFANLKRMLQSKNFGTKDDIIAETEVYFERLGKSFYKKGIEMLAKRWTNCIASDGDYVDE